MIRSTINEGISSLSKQRHIGASLINNGVAGESVELGEVVATGAKVELVDSINAHAATVTEFPSNAFAGTFE